MVRLDGGTRQRAEQRLLGDRVSRLWNAANYKCRQSFMAKDGVSVGAKLDAVMKDEHDYRQLPSDIAQEVLKKLSEAWKSYFELRRLWTNNSKLQKPGLPAYRKDKKTGERPFDLIPVKHPRSYAVNDRDVSIVLPRDRRKPYGAPGGRLHIAYRGRKMHLGKNGRAEMTYDATRRRWYFSWSVELDDVVPRQGGVAASIDLGVRIGASLSIDGQAKALHFENREVMKDWDWAGHVIALEQSHIANTRGPQPEERTPHSRAISLLHCKRRERVEHAQKCMAKAITEACVRHGVSRVYLGYPKNILRDVRYGSSAWAGRIHAFWSFDKMLGYLECALAAEGILSNRVGERGTSSHCPACGSAKVTRNPRWKLRCRDCGVVMHSDQAGSRNILLQNVPGAEFPHRAGAEAAPLTETLRWNRHRWVSRLANPKRDETNVLEFLAAA